MKKNLFFVAVAACAVLSFSSCKKEAKPVEEPVATEQPAAVSPVDQALNDYEKFMDEYVVFLKDMKTGKADVAKIQEWATKAEEMSKKFENTADYTPAQLEKFQKIAEKAVEAMK